MHNALRLSGSSWMLWLLLWCGGVLIFGSTAAYADIYTFTDANGVIHLTDRPLGPGYRLLISSASKKVKKWRGFPEKNTRANSLSKVIQYDGRQEMQAKRFVGNLDYSKPLKTGKIYSSTIHDAAQRYQIHSALIKAVIKAESNFNPTAVSSKGAVGLMQLMPGTASDLGVMDRTDPVANIHGGVRYLRELLGQFDNNLILSLAAYNAGPSAVKKYGNTVPPFQETQRYVAKVLNFYRAYLGSM